MVMTDRTEKRNAPQAPSQRAAAEALDELRSSGALNGCSRKSMPAPSNSPARAASCPA